MTAAAHDVARGSRWMWLNLLWAVPLASGFAVVCLFLARLRRCGLTECLGDPGGWASPATPETIAFIGAAAVVIAVTLLVIPWVRSWAIRGTVTLLVVAAFTWYGLWTVLFFVQS